MDAGRPLGPMYRARSSAEFGFMPHLSTTGRPKMLSVVAAVVVAWLWYVKSRRFERIKMTHDEYATRHGLKLAPSLEREHDAEWPTRGKYAMTPAEAQGIMLDIFWYEMPFLLNKSFEFALFKTYGIPSISRLLAQTAELKDPAKAGRRYVDTSTLITSFMAYPIEGPGSGRERTSPDEKPDPRGAVAIARMNWLHDRYRGKISNDDFLYTLSTFILEPRKWAGRFGWRALTPLEEEALFVFFAEVGRRMGIRDIPEELEQLYEWAEAYEREHMVADEANRDVALETVELLLFNVPTFARAFGRQAVSALVYPRLRKAIMMPPPPAWVEQTVTAAVKAVGLFNRFLLPPRSQKRTAIPVDKPAHVETHEQLGNDFKLGVDKVYAPRTHLNFYENEPWQEFYFTLFFMCLKLTSVHIGTGT